MGSSRLKHEEPQQRATRSVSLESGKKRFADVWPHDATREPLNKGAFGPARFSRGLFGRELFGREQC